MPIIYSRPSDVYPLDSLASFGLNRYAIGTREDGTIIACGRIAGIGIAYTLYNYESTKGLLLENEPFPPPRAVVESILQYNKTSSRQTQKNPG